jgi:hypothetical protein
MGILLLKLKLEAKRQGEVTNISQYMPEAVSQAVALCEITKHVIS